MIATIVLVAIGSSSTTHHSSSVAPKVVTVQRNAGLSKPKARKRSPHSASASNSIPANGICDDSAVRRNDITVNAHTSCPFARAVVSAYEKNPSATVDAYSSVTHLEYTLRCLAADGTVACKSETGDSTLAFTPPSRSSTPIVTASSTTQAVEGPGSYSHATDEQFCTSHSCIEHFPNGTGYVVQCEDGDWSHSGGEAGACSYHGGEG